MKILSAEQIKRLDAHTIKKEAIPSLQLMERAAMKCTEWLLKKYTKNEVFTILCGTGNNGGDGLAIARQLTDRGRTVKCYILASSKSKSHDFEANRRALQNVNLVAKELSKENEITKIEPTDVIIDALFGTGLSRPLTEIASLLVKHVNGIEAHKIAIDIPSGLYTNQPISKDSVVYKADYTLSFELPKLAFLLPENESYVGEWLILPIGLSTEFIEAEPTLYHFLTENDVAPILKKRKKYSHKGNYGHAYLACGSLGKMGAAQLAAKACLRSGVGLLTCITPSCGNDILQQAVPEAMTECQGEDFLEGIWDAGSKCVGIGSGIGQNNATQLFLLNLLKQSKRPLVLDADALNILAENEEWQMFIPDNSILTPHPKEFKRLVGTWSTDYEKLAKLQNLAKKLNCIIVLKGAHTAIAEPKGNLYFNSTGNAGMATGGTGDVLTGILTSLVAQEYTSLHAAILAVYLHGLAGDFAAKERSEEGMIASDIAEFLGKAMLALKQSLLTPSLNHY